MIFNDLSVLFESNKTEAIKAETEALKENIRTQLEREAVEDTTQADNTIEIITRMTASWDLLTTSVKGNIKAMLTWLATTPAGWATIAIGAIASAVTIYNLATDSIEELQEKATESVNSYKNVTDEVSSLNKELETTKDRISELKNKSSLSFTEQDELNRLKESNEELERQIKLKEIDAKLAQNEAKEDAYNYFNAEAEYEYFGSKENASKGRNLEGETVSGSQTSIIEKQIEDLNYFMDLQKEAVKNKEEFLSSFNYEGLTQDEFIKSLSTEDYLEYESLIADESFYDEMVDDLSSTINTAVSKMNELKISLDPEVEADAFMISIIDALNDAFIVAMGDSGSVATDKFNDLWNSEGFEFYKKRLEKAAKAGRDFNTDPTAVEGLQLLIKATGKSAEETEQQIRSMFETASEKGSEEPFSKTKMISSINGLSEGFEALDKIMESQKDENPFDYALLDDSKFKENFGGLGEVYEEFVETISNSPKDVKACQEAYNNLITEWVYSEEVLEGISEDTVNVTEAMLKNMGVTNAAEVVESALIKQKAKLAWETRESTNAIVDEIESLADENGVLDDGEKAWAAYIAQKMLDEVHNGNGDIMQLRNVMQALGVGIQAWKAYAYAKKMAMFSQGTFGEFEVVDESADGITTTHIDAESSRKQWEKIQYAIYEEIFQQFDSLIYDTKADINYDGGPKSNDSGSDPKEEEIDWIERKKEILQRLHDVQEEIANDENASYTERAKALDYLIAKDEERVDAANNAVSQYKQAWLDASANLTDEDKKFIEQGGYIVKKYNAQDLVDAGIVDSLDAGEEYIENLKIAQDWYDKMIESEKESLANEKETIEHKKKQIQLLRDQISAQQDLNGAITDQINSQKELDEIQGEYIGQDYYEELIRQSKEQESLHKETLDTLYEEFALTEEESAERDNLLIEIENCKNEIIQCQVEQAELNETIARLPIERLQMFRDLYADIIEDMDNYRSIQDNLGLNPTQEELQTYIDLYSESIDNALKQQSMLKDLLKNYSYGSDKFNETSDEIQSLDTEINNLIASQIELNNEMLQIPVNEMSEQIEKLGTAKTALQNSIAEDNAKGLQTTVGQYANLHSLTLQQLGLYAQQKEELTKLLDVYDEESEYYKETEQQIADIDSNMSSLVQETYQWNQELLNIPIENLEKVNENLSNYSSILDGIISEYDSALSGVNTLIDNEIEGVQDVLDALEEQNNALQIQRNLEQSLYNLRRAQEQKNVAVIRNGEKVWESNSDDLRNANQEYQDALLEKQKYELEQQIEHLNDIKEKWQEIIDKIQEAKDLQAAEDLFGSGWQDSVLADSADLRDMYQLLYESVTQEKEAVDKQIESNERISQMMNEFVTRYQEGSLTYEEALTGINQMLSSMEGGFSAFEQLNSMMNLDNISSLGDIASSAEAGITGSAELLEKYLGIVENNKADVEKFETDWNAASKGVEGIIDGFNVAVESMDGYIDAFNKNAEAISANTNTWTEMKELIEEQVKALKEAAEALEEQAKKPNKKPSGGSSSSSNSDDGDRDGTYIRVNGNDYSTKEGSAAEIIGTYGTDEEKKRYREYREKLINDKANKSGDEGWREAAQAQLDEELEKAGIPKYHTGIMKGPVGFTPLSNDSIYKFARRVAADPLKADEVAAILQKGEFVTQPEQMSNIMRNNQMIGQMAAEQANAINRVSTNAQAFSFSIGEVHLHEVQNVDEFAKALNQTFESSMQQNFSKIFKH